jgi:hypothetical protein
VLRRTLRVREGGEQSEGERECEALRAGHVARPVGRAERGGEHEPSDSGAKQHETEQEGAVRVRPEREEQRGRGDPPARRRGLVDQQQPQDQQRGEHRQQVRSQLEETIGGERREAARRQAREQRRAAGAAQGRPGKREDPQHDEDVRHAQPREAGGPREEREPDVRQPGRRRGRPRRGVQQRISGEPRAVSEVGLAHREMPPGVVGEERLPGRHRDEQGDGEQRRVDQPSRPGRGG